LWLSRALQQAIQDFFSMRVDLAHRRSTSLWRKVVERHSFLRRTKMVRRFLGCGLLLISLQVTAYGEDKAGAKLPPAPTNAGLEKLKRLAGTWVAAGQDGKPSDQVVSIIKVTAGGSAVHETLFPGQPHEMISVYTANGPDLLLTHYCVLGNQPRMKANTNSLSNQISFKFAGGANLDPKKDKHMHDATLTIVDDDHIEITAVAWEAGAPAKDQCCTGMKLIRRK
jgi:hypothetical protein